MSSVSASGVALPEGWAACIDPTHNVEYYFDLVNNCAQWEFPQAPATRAGGAVPAPTSDAANVPDAPQPAAVAAPVASDLREAGQHEAAAAGQAPTAAEAAGAQAALGALLDAEILADVYLLMTGGQTALSLDAGSGDEGGDGGIRRISGERAPLAVVRASSDEASAHDEFMAMMEKQAGETVWSRLQATE